MRPSRPAAPLLAASLLAAAASATVGTTAAAQEVVPYPTRCGVAIPTAEARGFVPLPSGDPFCPLVADPKTARSFVSYLRETSEDAETHVASVGIGDVFPMVRWGGPAPGDGVQLSLQGSVLAQFDLGSASFDLINADFIIGLPITWRRGGTSGRVRVYHQSSHLGDEFLLRDEDPRPERENLSFESLELILSQDLGLLRLYGGGEYLVNREPEDLESTVAHAGAELRPRGGVNFGRFGSVRPLAAVDVKATPEQDWGLAWSLRAGLDVGRPREAVGAGGRWSVLFEYYQGPSPYGQFYRNDVTLVGVGLHFAIQ